MDYKIVADYHVHSNMANKKPIGLFYKHAKSSIEENAEAAIKIGLKEIAITDHGPSHIYGISRKNYARARQLIDDLNLKYKNNSIDFKILLGVEANIISSEGKIDIDEAIIKYLDLICVGYHPGSINFSPIKRNYMATIKKVLENYRVAILNHPKYKVDIDLVELGRIASKTGTAIELNGKRQGDFSAEEIKRLKDMGVVFSLGSDSHRYNTIGKFDSLIETALKAGLTNDDIVNANGLAHKKLKLL